MRVYRRIVERSGNGILQRFTDHMFQLFGLGMHLVPR